MNPILLQYQWEMKETLRRGIQENYVGGVREAERAKPVLVQENLLPPPCIMYIFLEGYEGQGDDFIGIVAFHDFGIASMRILILDEWGGVIESGEASPYPDDPELWEYLPTARVPLGTPVTVHVTATDCIDGIGRRWGSKTLGEAQL